jgi:hypothetical protein
MSDQPQRRVVLLDYVLELPSGWKPITPWRSQLGDFDVELDEKKLSARPRGDYPSIEAAQVALEPHLWALIAHADLRQNTKLAFQSAGGQLESLATKSQHLVVVPATASMQMRYRIEAQYRPEAPPVPFTDSNQVRLLRTRWRDAREGRSPMLAESQFVLTSLEGRFGGRRKSAKSLALQLAILNKLGELGERQHERHGRKVKVGQPHLSDTEVTWMDRAVPALIYRLAEIEGGAKNLRQIAMSDFPPLP